LLVRYAFTYAGTNSILTLHTAVRS